MHILITEDAPDVAEVVAFSARLTWPDATVTTAGGGADALAVFDAEPANLIILDVNMSPPDGYTVCQQIRARSDVPILMLTVRDSIVDKMRGFDLGVDDKVFVRRLRQKLGDNAAQPRSIQTEWGVGYRFVGPYEQA